MYTLDTTAARAADRTGGYIDQIGKYVGTFKQAVDITAKTGARGIALTFDSNGQKANISIYTKNAAGEAIFGMNTLNAIMACLQLRGITPQQGTYTQYDAAAQAEVSTQGQVFPDLCNKPIGLLLETEDYANAKGEIRTRMVLAGIFQAGTELVASEILDRKTTPEMLPKMVARLHHRPIKAANKPHAPSNAAIMAAQAPAPTASGSGFAGMDDDIPFANPLRSRAMCLCI